MESPSQFAPPIRLWIFKSSFCRFTQQCESCAPAFDKEIPPDGSFISNGKPSDIMHNTEKDHAWRKTSYLPAHPSHCARSLSVFAWLKLFPFRHFNLWCRRVLLCTFFCSSHFAFFATDKIHRESRLHTKTHFCVGKKSHENPFILCSFPLRLWVLGYTHRTYCKLIIFDIVTRTKTKYKLLHDKHKRCGFIA